MTDNLEYIRKAVKAQGKYARVKVLRFEINRFDGSYQNPVEIEVNGALALEQLMKPYNTRIHNFKKIRPLGDIGKSAVNYGFSNLESPELLSKMKEEARAELEAELREKIKAEYDMAASLEEKPKRRKKSEEESNELDTLNSL
jgi:hypothetical protein